VLDSKRFHICALRRPSCSFHTRSLRTTFHTTHTSDTLIIPSNSASLHPPVLNNTLIQVHPEPQVNRLALQHPRGLVVDEVVAPA
jgi:hypothetical protein